MFPEFIRFTEATKLLEKKFSGNLAAKLPRILGQGKTKAVGLDLPPAPIERKMELSTLIMPEDYILPNIVKEEIQRVKTELDDELRRVSTSEGARSLASNVIKCISSENKGLKNDYFYVGSFLLIPDKNRTSWSWSVTPHYPIIEKIPPDMDYIVKAYSVAEDNIQRMIFKVDIFEKMLELSWLLARHFSQSDDVLLIDAAKMFRVAAQDSKFWNEPLRKFFTDLPAASFIANLLHYKRNHVMKEEAKFEFIPATLQQAYSKPFYLPMDKEGTQTRPYIYIRKKNSL